MNEGFQYFEQHWTSRFDMELLKILQCKALKGQGFEEKAGRKDIFQSDTVETIRLPGSSPQIPKNVEPDNTVEIYIGGPKLFILQIGRI